MNALTTILTEYLSPNIAHDIMCKIEVRIPTDKLISEVEASTKELQRLARAYEDERNPRDSDSFKANA